MPGLHQAPCEVAEPWLSTARPSPAILPPSLPWAASPNSRPSPALSSSSFPGSGVRVFPRRAGTRCSPTEGGRGEAGRRREPKRRKEPGAPAGGPPRHGAAAVAPAPAMGNAGRSGRTSGSRRAVPRPRPAPGPQRKRGHGGCGRCCPRGPGG